MNTLAHEIRTPLAVSQGYLKLYLDGRLATADDTRKAFEQTRQALGVLAALCVDMGKVSTLAESGVQGVPQRIAASDFARSLRDCEELAGASFEMNDAVAGSVESGNARDLALAVAIVAKAAFDETKGQPHTVHAASGEALGEALIVTAGVPDALPALHAGADAPEARAVDFGKGGKGLKLIWAAFVLDKHGVQTWTLANQKSSVGFRIPLVKA